MTYIEFLDKNAIENVCAALIHTPQRVVLVGYNEGILITQEKRYRKLFSERGQNIEFAHKTVSCENIKSILNALTEIIESYEDCAFDLTGGDDLYLVAIGILSERYKQKNIQMHRFNIIHGKIKDCDQDGKTITETDKFEISVKENIQIYGGDIVFDDVKVGATHIWELDDEFKDAIKRLWNMCRKNEANWNVQTGIFDEIVANHLLESSDASIAFSEKSYQDILEEKKVKPITSENFIKQLCNSGFITRYTNNDGQVSITFKNEQIKMCLTKAGQVFEMIIYLAGLEATDEQNNAFYNDAMTGVVIDWDGKIHEGKNEDIINEIDVMLMKGMVPYFISCKNGLVEVDELYKFDTVVRKFGGKYARKILITPKLKTKNISARLFAQRAKDMKISIVETLHVKNYDELKALVKKLW